MAEHMKPQDIFGIILRSIAFWLCVWGAWNTIAGIKYLLPTITAWISGTTYQYDSFGYFIYGLPAFLSGIIILRFADFFVRFTYPRRSPPPLPDFGEPSKPETQNKL
jgi:hypothetical protein